MIIDDHIGCAMSGLTADARTLVEHGRVETQVRFKLLVDCPPPINQFMHVNPIFFLSFYSGHNRSKGNRKEELLS